MAAAISSHRDKLERCLLSEQLESVPVALWRHFPVDDQDPYLLAKAISAFQNQFDFDLIKVTPASTYSVKDWGVTDVWHGNAEGTRDYQPVIITPDDWYKLMPLDPVKGELGRSLETLKVLKTNYGYSTPVLQTIFSPLSQAKHLVGKSNLLIHLRQYPETLHHALRVITETTCHYIQEVLKTGIDGIFFAVQHANPTLLSRSEFLEFGKSYDLMVAQEFSNFWLNIAHIHGEPVMFNDICDYPVQVLNWHDQSTWPSLFEGKKKSGRVVCGGIRQWETMVLGAPEDVKREAMAAIKETDGRGFILGTGCVVPTTAPFGNIMAARTILDEV